MDQFEETTLGRRCVFDGRLLKVDSIDVELPDGRKSVREVIRHPGAAVVLVRDGRARFIFVRQYRKAAEKTMLEVVAGTLNEGEVPAECALREAAEETGMTVGSLVELGVIYPAPGYSSEKLYLFLGDVTGADAKHKADEDENIERVFLSEAEIDVMINDGLVEDAKTLAIWHLYKTKQRQTTEQTEC